MQELSMYSHSSLVKNGTYSYTKCMKALQNPHKQSLYKYHHPRVHAALMSFQIQEQIYVCTVGQEVLEYLGQHVKNIVPSG